MPARPACVPHSLSASARADLQGLSGPEATTGHVTQCFLGAGLRAWPRHLPATAHLGQCCQAIEAAPQCVFLGGGLSLRAAPPMGARWLSPLMGTFCCWMDRDCQICIWYSCSQRPGAPGPSVINGDKQMLSWEGAWRGGGGQMKEPGSPSAAAEGWPPPPPPPD